MKKIYLYILSFLIATSSVANTTINKDDLITVISIVGMPSTVCANESFTISFTSSGFTPNTGNTYDIQLSDASGSFASPTVIGSEPSTASAGTVDLKVPFNTALGANYQVRIVATSTDLGSVTGEIISPININCTTRDYYWVDGSGNWTDLSHWEYTINDIDFFDASEVPTLNDNVNFDEFSFPNGGILTVDQEVFCNDMYWSPDVTSGPQLYARPGNNINVYGDLVMANGVYRDVDRFMFRSPTNYAIIDLADNTMKLNSNVYWGDGYLDFYGNSSWELESDVVAEGVRLYDNSVVTSNDFSLDLDYTLYLGAGTFNAGNSNISLFRLEEYGTFNAESSTLTFNKGTGFISGDATVNNAVFESGDYIIEGNNTFTSLRLTDDVKIKIEEGTIQTVTTNFEALGSRAKMIDIQSKSPGNSATLDLGSSTSLINFIILQDNTVLASSTPVSAFNSIDNGNNTNWNISPIASFEYFWIGGSGNWSDPNHWATTDGGSTLRTDPPGPVDNVNFTTNSFPSGGKITLDIPADCNNMIWADGTSNPTISSIDSNPLTIRGNFQLAAGVTRDIDDLRFESVSSNVLTFAESSINTVGNITFEGTGSWALQDALSTYNITLNGGTLNTNNNNITVGWNFDINGGALFLGSSQLTLALLGGSSPSSFNANTSTVIFDGKGNGTEGIIGDYTFNDVVLKETLEIFGNNIFENISMEEGAKVKFQPGTTQTFNQSLSINGSRNNMTEISSSNSGNQAFWVTANGSANYDVNYVKMQDISLDNASGFSTFEMANNSIDQGGNIGWDFASNPLVATNYYWVGGQGEWTDAANHWSSTDGGSPNLTDLPGELDDVFFTGFSSFVADDTVLLDVPASVHTMTWQDGSANPVIDDGNNNALTLSGSLFMVNGVKRSINTINFDSDATNNVIQMAGNEGNVNDINFLGTGTWTMLDSLASTSVYIEQGSLKTNNNPLWTTGYLQNFGTIDLGTSNVYIWYYFGYAPASLGGETIYVEPTGTLSAFSGNFNNIILNGDVEIRDTNVINNLSATEPGSTLTFYSSTTTTINSSLTVKGVDGNPINIISNNPGIQATINMPGTATVTAEYVSIQDNNGTGGATFSTSNSALYSNVTGWTGLLGQTISMTTVDVPFADGAVSLNAVVDSSLPLTYTITRGDASINGNILTPNSPGLVSIQAEQVGDATYAPAKIERYIHFNATEQSNELGNFKEATYVVGQKDFVSNDFFFDVNKTPQARKVFVTKDGKLISSGYRRVLIWNKVPGATNVPADVVLGQPDFNSSNFAVNSSTIYSAAYAIAVSDDGRLLVGDSRGIMIWNTIPTVNGTPADVIIGQEDFNTTEYGAVDNHFQSAEFFILTPDQKLIISDLQGNRVMIYNTIPTTNGASADVVIGQDNFNSINPGTGLNQMDGPGYPGLSPDGKLFIPDARNNRVLVYNSVPTVSGASADYVLGQADPNETVVGLSSTEYNYPYSVAISKSGKMAVTDRGNNRVLIYNTVPSSNTVEADFVLGQPDFVTNGANTGGISGRSVNLAYAAHWDVSNNLYVGDLSNNRFLVWGLPDFTAPLDFTTGEVVSAGPTVVQGYWNSTNSSVEITIPIADDPTLIAGEIQIFAKFGTGTFNPIGQPFTIEAASIGATQIVSINSATLSALPEFIEGNTMSFSATIADAAGNSTTGTESASSLIIDTIIPAIDTDNSTMATTYVEGQSTQSLLSMIADTSGIKEVIIKYNLISSELPGEFNDLVLTKDASDNFVINYKELVDISNEKHGIVYYIEIVDNAGNKYVGVDNKQSVNIKYPNGIAINNFGVGATTESYKMMAIPLNLESNTVNEVFDEVYGDTFDKSKMRIFSYAGGNATSYNELSGSSRLNMGVGYFALAASETTVGSPAGATSFEVFQDVNSVQVAGYSINLVPGWNMIGNPFMHAINWAEIESLSQLSSGDVDAPQIYDGTNFPTVTSIPANSGAFIHNNTGSTITIKIPARNITSGRIASSSPNHNSLIEDSWEVIFTTKGTEGNTFNLGGIGMEPEAYFSKDQYDVLNPPTFPGMKVMSFDHPEFSAHSFKIDVRESSVEEKWDFEYRVESESVEKQTINWDNSYFGENTPDLYLVDKTHFTTINMKEVNSYTFNHGGETKFELYFGDNVLDQIIPTELITQSPFPNPFSNEITFNIGLPQDDNYSVEIRIFDSVGKLIRDISKSDMEAGYNSILWDGLNNNGRATTSGMYAYSIHIKGSTIDTLDSGKIIKR